MPYIYRHIRLDKNEPFYIGIGSDDEGKYKRAYGGDRNNHWNNIVKNFPYDVEILLDDLSWEEACEKEKEFIQLYGRKDLGNGTLVNLTDGGEGTLGSKHNVGKKRNVDSRLKMSNSRKNVIPWNKGLKGYKYHFSEEGLKAKKEKASLPRKKWKSSSKKGKTKYTEDIFLNVLDLRMQGFDNSTIAQKLNINGSALSNVILSRLFKEGKLKRKKTYHP